MIIRQTVIVIQNKKPGLVYKREDIRVSYIKKILCIFAVSGVLAGCAPEVGSEAWCKKLSGKPKGEWTANEAADFTRHCLLK